LSEKLINVENNAFEVNVQISAVALVMVYGVIVSIFEWFFSRILLNASISKYQVT